METIKNIAIYSYFFFITFTIICGSLMEYFGNSNGKYIMLPGIILGIYQSIKSDN